MLVCGGDCWRRRKIKKLTEEQVSDFLYGTNCQDSENKAEEEDLETQIQGQGFNSDLQILRADLRLCERNQLGSGQYGTLVVEGWLKNDGVKAYCRGLNSYANYQENGDNVSGEVKVAVKTLKSNTDTIFLGALLSEIKIMAYVGFHSNIVGLIGADTENIDRGEIRVAVEYCGKKDLLQHLRKSRKKFQNLFKPPAPLPTPSAPVPPTTTKSRKSRFTSLKSSANTGESEQPKENVTTFHLLSWARGIANGMLYLTSKKIIHGNLAAKNILLTNGNIAKIDFGISRNLLHKKQDVIPPPFQWMSIEAALDLQLSTQSDIYSFGILLYEIMSLGNQPFPGLQFPSYYEQIRGGQRMEKPEFSNKETYELMLNCWELKPENRPTGFDQIGNRLQTIIESLERTCGGSKHHLLKYYCIVNSQ